MNKIAMPLGARAIVQGLRYANYDAYVVGGILQSMQWRSIRPV